VADGDEVAVVVSVGDDDGALGDGQDEGADGGGDVDAGVEVAAAGTEAAGELAHGGCYPLPRHWAGEADVGGTSVACPVGTGVESGDV